MEMIRLLKIFSSVWISLFIISTHPTATQRVEVMTHQNILERGAQTGGIQRTAEGDNGTWEWPLTEEQIQAVVDTHNSLRRDVEPEPSDMMKMTWSDWLAGAAQNWSENCVFDHPNDPGYGQNLYLGTEDSIVNAIEAWYSEVEYYDYDEDTCEEGKTCGHYTQVVWATSVEVGCGIEECDNSGKIGYLITCNYSPAGNAASSRPYQSGHNCSQCSNPSWCDNGLCDPDCVESELTTDCDCHLLCLNCALMMENNCSCSCKPGFTGIDCGEICEDNDDRCNNGWYEAQCGQPEFDYVDDKCPLMCGHCDGGPYVPEEHCCEGKQCEEGVINGETCECECHEEYGEEYGCGSLKPAVDGALLVAAVWLTIVTLRPSE